MNESPDNTQMSFENALKALEGIVEQMSSTSLSLDELIAMYEEGIRYLHQCQKDLEAAELKINALNERIKEYSGKEDDNG